MEEDILFFILHILFFFKLHTPNTIKVFWFDFFFITVLVYVGIYYTYNNKELPFS